MRRRVDDSKNLGGRMREMKRGTVRDLRRENRAAVLWSLYLNQSGSRHEVSAATGLSPASVTSVIRELIDGVRYRPTSGRFKIYIIDEVHMLSTNAFNALLKTLEEPPEHVKFIFATTEPQKVLPTILSRCQRFDLHRIPANLIARAKALDPDRKLPAQASSIVNDD